MRQTPLEAALQYARLGLHVFPVHTVQNGSCSCGKSNCDRPGKHPTTPHGFHDATTDEKKIRAWWGSHPYLNVAIRTGPSSGIVGLDIDPRNGGGESLERLKREYGPLPRTWVCRTGSGGVHVFFKHPRVPVRSRQGILPGVDVKGDTGYVVADPSRHLSGKAYQWIHGPDTTPLARIPDRLLQLVQGAIGSLSPAPAQPQTRSLSAIEAQGVEQGARDTSLTRAVGRWITQSHPMDEIVRKAIAWSRKCRPPYSENDTMRVVHSIVERAVRRRSPERKATILMRGKGLPATARCVLYGLIGLRGELGKHGRRGKDGMSLVAPYRVISRFSLVPLKSIKRALTRLEAVGLIRVRQVRPTNRDYTITVVTFLNPLAEMLSEVEKQQA